jgi:hypothetical protein
VGDNGLGGNHGKGAGGGRPDRHGHAN